MVDKQYLMTVDQLYDIGTIVGPLDTQSFDSLERTATRLAKRLEIKNPQLVIDRKYKNEFLTDFERGKPHMPAPLVRDDWEVYLEEAVSMMEEVPDVYLVDGDKFTASI